MVSVNIDETDVDNPSFIPFFLDKRYEILRESIKNLGVINLPIMKEINGKFKIILGLRRIIAARSLGFKHINVRVLDVTDEDAIRLSAEDNYTKRGLSESEKAIYVEKLSTLGNSAQTIAKMLRGAGIPNEDYVQRLLRISTLPYEILEALHNGKIDPKSTLKITRMEDIKKVVAMKVLSMDATLSERKQLIDLIDKVSNEDILKETEKEISEGYEIHSIIDMLLRANYPTMMRATEELEREISDLKIKVIYPPNFEGDKIKVEFSFGTSEDLTLVHDEMEKFFRRANKIIRILRG
jgi:ParB/RepB/Spo0J family partition protein